MSVVRQIRRNDRRETSVTVVLEREPDPVSLGRALRHNHRLLAVVVQLGPAGAPQWQLLGTNQRHYWDPLWEALQSHASIVDVCLEQKIIMAAPHFGGNHDDDDDTRQEPPPRREPIPFLQSALNHLKQSTTLQKLQLQEWEGLPARALVSFWRLLRR